MKRERKLSHSFRGALLCTLRTKAFSYQNKVEVQPWMFVIVTIEDGIIEFPWGMKANAQPLIELAIKRDVDLKEVIEDYIQNSPTILKSCIQHRVGYARPKRPYSRLKTPYINNQENEARFVTKILREKGDLDNLTEYQKTL